MEQFLKSLKPAVSDKIGKILARLGPKFFFTSGRTRPRLQPCGLGWSGQTSNLLGRTSLSYSYHNMIFWANSDLTKCFSNEKLSTFFFYASDVIFLSCDLRWKHFVVKLTICIYQSLRPFIRLSDSSTSWCCNFNDQQCIYGLTNVFKFYKMTLIKHHKHMKNSLTLWQQCMIR